MRNVFHHPFRRLVAVFDLLRKRVDSPATMGELVELTGTNAFDVRYLIHNLRYGLGVPVQAQGSGEYFISTREDPATKGSWVKTPGGVGRVTWAREGFSHIQVKLSDHRVGRFARADCTTMTHLGDA